MASTSITTVQSLRETRQRFDVGVSYAPGERNPFAALDDMIPSDATYYERVFEGTADYDLAIVVFKAVSQGKPIQERRGYPAEFGFKNLGLLDGKKKMVLLYV